MTARLQSVEYTAGADLPDLALTWRDASGANIDLTGYTLQLKLGQPGAPATLTKTSGITGAATDPNVTIAWSTIGELNTLPIGAYIGQLRAERTADAKHRFMTFVLVVHAAIT